MVEQPKRTDIDREEFRKRLIRERNRMLRLHRKQRADMAGEMSDRANKELSHNSSGEYENSDQAATIEDTYRDELLDQNEMALVGDIDHALKRLEDGVYGICEVTGQPIPVERLRALPWATTVVDALEAPEERGRRE